MAQQLKAFAARSEDLSSVPYTSVVGHYHPSCFKGCDTLLWLLNTIGTNMVYIRKFWKTLIHIKIMQSLKIVKG